MNGLSFSLVFLTNFARRPDSYFSSRARAPFHQLVKVTLVFVVPGFRELADHGDMLHEILITKTTEGVVRRGKVTMDAINIAQAHPEHCRNA
jgi:hypothetical protein